MRIAIINLTGGGMSGGYRKYLRNIVPRIAKHDSVEAILCALPDSLNFRDLFEQVHNVEFVDCRPFRFLHQSPDSQFLPHLKKFLPDLLFIPMGRYIRFNDIPVVNMIQNMEPLICPNEGNPISEILRNWLRAKNAQKAVNKADRVIAVSDFVKSYLINHWRISSDKIGMVYHGINLPKGNVGIRPPSIPTNWEGRFLFTAGSIRPARGLEDLLLAMKNLSLQGEKSVRLVIAGESGHRMADYQKKLKDWAQEHNLADRIYWTGNLNERELAWCYQNGSAFIMTSRVESFGMIGGEAMSHGCICISADNPCLPELFKDASVYYPPKNGKALAEAIKTVLTWDNNQRKAISEKAKKRAAEFSWDVCVEKTVAVLAKAAEDR